MEPIIETKNLSRSYGTDETAVYALKSCSIQIFGADKVVIIGASGSGKSTLLHLLGGLDRPSDGSVLYHGKDLYQMSDNALSIFRRRNIGFVFQSFNLVPEMTAQENIVLPLLIDGKKEDKAYFTEIVSALGLEERLDHLPSELSGGQQQRVAIARAIINKPSVIFCDEPTGNLDSKNSKEVIQLLNDTSTKFGIALVIVTHDQHIAESAQRLITIADGVVGGNINES